MTVVLARFAYGFALAWIAAAIFLGLAVICLGLVRRSVQSFETERQQDLASGLAVFVAVMVALAACYASGHALHAWLGKSALVAGQAQWLAGNSHVSAAALMGATVALGLAAAAPGLWRRLRTPRAEQAREPARAPKAAKKSPAKKDSKAPKASARSVARPPRVAALGWAALFVMLLGAILLAFAYIVAPLDPTPLAAGADAKMIARASVQAEHILRARPIYYAAAALLGAGGLIFVAWLLSRRSEAA
ncbi:hypothetical protein [Bordetella genomosp. 12]|uniref:Uncharacterized protein n=1 Tax=Bordetella genomosp. 12 TaxID=463035 RepID=A0A261VMV1_9BORD|nr:hypothetical protein [Bordetella genomosp. 12]OZI74900.1 hypothetical protein CAL22_10750 [Bordetella genomosp. 12]